MKLAEENKCCGCWACASACPKSCIQMMPDSEGFLRPVVDISVCVKCGMCQRACPVLTPAIVPSSTTQVYGAFTQDESIRLESTSGGIFTELCRWTFRQGGVVFGAAYDKDFSVKHCCIESETDLWKLRGAKYAQSEINNVFCQVKQLLEQNRIVLFSGTPCQIAGLQTFLGKSWDSLLLVDVICHGVPSPAVWQHYIEYRSRIDADGNKPVLINLRSKETGWPRYSIRFDYENGVSYTAQNSDDPFLRSFVGDLCLRPSCYNCNFKGISRTSDFTLGDYWGIEGQLPELHDGKGTSLVFIHSNKAKAIWTELSSSLCFREADPNLSVKYNSSAIYASVMPDNRSTFMFRYLEENFATLTNELLPLSKKTTSFSLLQRVIHRVIQKITKGSNHLESK